MSAESHDAEGNSPAAWTAVIIMLVAFAIGTIAFWFDIPWVVFASVGLLAVGPIVGLFLARAGYGVNSPRRDTADS
ncbi:hypothetical protein B0I08_101534 [Glaciihabitans tibetensis]|uniref:Uncharacterized protein n=1 Tax=Glaciihabitans tibetensis TaxID=1266600 RepID=A0A2T0VJN2_9MICO|nr:DUF6704 family protein [Glaciihabitans tibetensis]PRY70399.1 hypothetical protein B0I08_101534 [Glaciihabitans tibetensis]